jgi:hypothetical protein
MSDFSARCWRRGAADDAQAIPTSMTGPQAAAEWQSVGITS